MFRKRLFTGLLLLSIAVSSFLYLDKLAFSVFCGTVILVGSWEWPQLAGYQSKMARFLFSFSILLVILILDFYPTLTNGVLISALIWWISVILLLLKPSILKTYCSHKYIRIMMGFLVLVPTWQGLVVLNDSILGRKLLILLMFIVWAYDIGAYVIGSKYGKWKLLPHVSPGKTWEGLTGGFISSLLVAVVINSLNEWQIIGNISILFITATIVIFSIIGDLTESLLKRHASLKDTGDILPGHGGVLDRIDSLTAAIPIFTILVKVILL